MREQYLPSVCQLHAAIYNNEISVPESDILLKQNEVTTLQYLVAQLLFFSKGNHEILDRYFVGYSIPQLGNEFDLLRGKSNGNYDIAYNLASKSTDFETALKTFLKILGFDESLQGKIYNTTMKCVNISKKDEKSLEI